MADRGRPSVYTPEVAEEILRRLSGGETLIAICRSEHMPSEGTVRGWVMKEPAEGFSSKYAEARLAGYARMADELMEIADDGRNDWMEREDGPQVNGEAIQRSRLRVDTRKWLLSKALPKLYGDKLIHAGSAEEPIEVKHSGAADILRAAVEAVAERKGE